MANCHEDASYRFERIPKELSPIRCCRGKPGGSEPTELSRWISPGTLGHTRTYTKHRRTLPQIQRKTDGAEVTIEKHDTEFTEHAHDGSDDGRWTGRRDTRWQPRCRRRRSRARRCRRWRVLGRRGDQETTDGQQASGELRLDLVVRRLLRPCIAFTDRNRSPLPKISAHP